MNEGMGKTVATLALCLMCSCEQEPSGERAGANISGRTTFNPSIATEKRIRQGILNGARQYTAAMQRGDYDRATRMMPSEMVSAMGGTRAASAFVEQELTGNGIRLVSAKVKEPTSLVFGDSEWLAIVPYDAELEIDDNAIETCVVWRYGYLVAISEDRGGNWGFLEGGWEQEKTIRSVYPLQAAQVVFPQRRMIAGTGTGEGLLIEQVEVEGEWRPTEQTREELGALLDRAKNVKTPTRPAKEQEAEADADKQVFRSDAHGFTILFPKDWIIKGGIVSETIVKAVDPDKSESINLIGVSSYDMEMRQDLWELDSGTIALAMAEKSPGITCSVLKSGKVMLDGRHALWSETLTKAGGAGVFNLNYFVMKGERLYWIYGGCDGTREKFKSVVPTFRACATSFQFSER